jgi:hypothetical protein
MNTASLNAAQIKEKRADYLAGKISHHDYYLWLGKLIGVSAYHLPVKATEQAVKACKDDHLNCIQLQYWDAQHSLVHGLIRGKVLSWSLSDTVCVLKALAVELYRK